MVQRLRSLINLSIRKPASEELECITAHERQWLMSPYPSLSLRTRPDSAAPWFSPQLPVSPTHPARPPQCNALQGPPSPPCRLPDPSDYSTGTEHHLTCRSAAWEQVPSTVAGLGTHRLSPTTMAGTWQVGVQQILVIQQ